MWRRRSVLAAGTALPLAGWLAGCSRTDRPGYTGGWVGAQHERGHRLRDLGKSGNLPAPALQRKTGVAIIGAGVAGLACARELLRRGVDDVQLFELEDSAGGNSRGHRIAGMACPLGAHYLPLPGEYADEIAQLLDELGLRRVVNGQPVYDERHLCHSPQERINIGGHWHDGLLPPIVALPAAERAATLAQYRRFAERVDDAGRGAAFTIPTWRSTWSPALDALDQVTFAHWLDAQQLDAPALRWYLDYCCRDDYGAGAGEVSAWAGLHYFASRHGFRPPGAERDDHDGVLTWPEGNAWLAERIAQPLREHIHTGRVALKVVPGRDNVTIDLWNAADTSIERWTAAQVVFAVPLFVAVRLLETQPAALTSAAQQMRHAPWMVANLHLAHPLADRPGAALAWDNVIYGAASLGYVDAMHQSTLPYAGPTVLTSYWSWGADPARRAELLATPWASRAAQVVQDLAVAHPDLPAKVRHVDLMRYGHAMSIPTPGMRSSAALRALGERHGRIAFAHADLSAYSVFEEAWFHGLRAAQSITASGR